ncbi:F-box/FBD/LRR-repeat protein At1g13570-like isoform X1 [Vicia villosa]|uniref:F-box/FBD/LRR-repeat protein At1g13570-like isoform X1 n=1 Tax=Vicia villosa TaxID=3911 RepID=UPI00273A86F6|nr:F-box/FBD/LRR-repeat protein At1g13570-like isoform X1 [Vicia villosa]
MTLLNKKANENDQISYLPGNVIDAILGNLEIKDQVRTSILSKNWRYMWTSAPQLHFDQDFFNTFMHLDDPNPVISKIITDVLMLHSGPIHKFTLYLPYDSAYFDMEVEYLNIWIPILSRKGIKYLDFVNFNSVPDEIPYIIFSCKELTYLKFGGFNMSIPPDFCGFKKLLELHLDMLVFEPGALETLVSGCPFLEKLIIESCDGYEYLDISSPTLKVLEIVLRDDMKSISLEKATNLVDFTLDVNGIRVYGLIKSLPKIKRLSVRKSMYGKKEKYPYADIIPLTLLASSFNSLEYLQLHDMSLNEKGELLYVVSVLKSAPRLTEFAIYQSCNNDDTSDYFEELQECWWLRLELEEYCWLGLQIVDIYLGGSPHHAMSLTQFILLNSPLLETLTFNYCYKELDAPMLLKISQELLLMERVSPKAQVEFNHSTFL